MTHPYTMFHSQDQHWKALYTVYYALKGHRPKYANNAVFDLWVRMILSKKGENQ